MATDIGWESVAWPGLEHLVVSAGASGYTADSSLVIAEDELVRVAYRLECDAAWRFTRLSISVMNATARRTLDVSADGQGHWSSGGQPLRELDGCVDIDIDCTPLTNTLPIRRLDWSPGTARDLDVAYVSVPALTLRPVRQRYTLLDRDLFRYESGSFTADLPVDGDGYVTDYPGYWRRVASRKEISPAK
jgi:uncharacterized protein